jgi:nucleoside-diphosphate-sugar epimerase
MSRIIVTGASGFVGSALMQYLRARGLAAIGVSRRAGPLVDCVVGAYDNLAQITTVLREGDVIIHLAARAHQTGTADDAAFADNIRTTRALLTAARQSGAARFVFVSSIGVNGHRTVAAPFTEKDTPSPAEPYARSKLACEQAVAQAGGDGLKHVIVRPPLVYGPDAPGNFARLARAVARGWPLPLGAVRNRRSFVAVANLVDFLHVCAQHPAAIGQTFLIADGEDLSTPQWIARMAKAIGLNSPPLLAVPEPWLRLAGTILDRRAAVDRVCDSLQVDITLARSRLDWSPVMGVDEGLLCAMMRYRAQ